MKLSIKTAILMVASIPLLGIGSFETLFAPKADPWPRWKTNVPESVVRADHAPWDSILQCYLHAGAGGINRFDYARLNRDGRDELDAYLQGLATTPVSRMDRASQMAFWINLYNALTVRTVAEAYPVKSIRDIDITPGFFGDGPWGKQLIQVEGVALTLNDIEHRILRPLWGDPRVHYALNCASLGCPNLAPSAYRPASLDSTLDRGARAFVNSPRGVSWDGNQSDSIKHLRLVRGGLRRRRCRHIGPFAPLCRPRLGQAPGVLDTHWTPRLRLESQRFAVILPCCSIEATDVDIAAGPDHF